MSAQFIDPSHNWWSYITIIAEINNEFVSEHLQQTQTYFPGFKWKEKHK